jgi:hypothetical protein
MTALFFSEQTLAENDKRQTTNDKRQTTNDKRQTTNDKRQKIMGTLLALSSPLPRISSLF